MTKSPKQRFTQGAGKYARYRPGYPAGVVDLVLAVSGVGQGGVVADVGSGTGIFTRFLLEHGLTVYAVEPNAAMRAEAKAAYGEQLGFHSVTSSAEDTTLADGSVDLVTCAHAFHWFDVKQSQREFRRILHGAQWVALIWNTRRLEGTPFLAAYEAFLQRFGADYKEIGLSGSTRDERVSRFFAPGPIISRAFRHTQRLDREGLHGLVGSLSYLSRPGSSKHPGLVQALDTLFGAHARDGAVEIEYDTDVFIGKI